MTSGNAAARHFATGADRYSELRDTGILGRIRRQEQRAVRELAPISPGELVLDVGCGDGAILSWLQELEADAVGIDISLAMARECADEGHTVSVQDMQQIAVRPVFDWVLCIGSLEFTSDPGQALANLVSRIVPGGRIVLLYPRRGVLGALYTLYHRSHRTPIHTFTARGVSSLLERAGCEPPRDRRRCLLADVCVSHRARPLGG